MCHGHSGISVCEPLKPAKDKPRYRRTDVIFTHSCMYLFSIQIATRCDRTTTKFSWKASSRDTSSRKTQPACLSLTPASKTTTSRG